MMPTPLGSAAYARFLPSCGGCHGLGGGPMISVVPTARVLTPSQQISINVVASGGPPKLPQFPVKTGGLAADVTRGTLVAGTGTFTNPGGTALTHNTKFNNRTWTMGYKAPSTPGLAEFYVVVNAVDGTGNQSGDQWDWHGSTLQSPLSVPVRFYVNATGVQSVGTGCADGHGNVGVYGAAHTPTAGKTLRLEAAGLPPGQPAILVFGFAKSFTPVSLAGNGAAGCFLNTDVVVQVPAGSSTTNNTLNRQQATGTFSLEQTLPPGTKGLRFRTQLWVADPDSKRPLKAIFTNGLVATVR